MATKVGPKGNERRRAPRGQLTREAIVEAALELLRGETDTPLTMARVADALGTRPMSLYTHITNRDDLLAAVADRAFTEWVVEIPDDASWEDEVRVWSTTLRACLLEYPLLVWEIASNGRSQPAFLANIAGLSRSLRRTGVAGRELADLLRWVPQTVVGAIVLELSRPAGLASVDDEATAIYASLGELAADDRAELLPVLEHFSGQSLDDFFGYSVERMIDAIKRIAMEETP